MNYQGFPKSNEILEVNVALNYNSIGIIAFICMMIMTTIIYSYIDSAFAIEHINNDSGYNNTSNKKSNVHKDTSLARYQDMIKESYPVPVRFIDSIVTGPAILFDGVSIARNTTLDQINFSKWTNSPNLKIYSYAGPTNNISFFTIQSTNFQMPVGFVSNLINYQGKYVSLNFGNIIKNPRDNQVAIDLEIEGMKQEYKILLVNGRLGLNDWVNNTRYMKIQENSSLLLDLPKIIAEKKDEYLRVKKFTIVIEKDTNIASFPFRLDLGKSTLNLPTVISPLEQYYLSGMIFDGGAAPTNSTYVLDNWNFKQLIDQIFYLDPHFRYDIQLNGWDITGSQLSHDPSSNYYKLRLSAEKIRDFRELNLYNIVQSLDIIESAKRFGSPKDLLFVLIICIITLSLIPNLKNFKGVKN